MDGSQLALIALVVAVVLTLLVPWAFRAPGRAMRKRFISLGSLKGKTRKEIVKVVGAPSQETPLPDGRTLLQWRATGYHIALVFEKNDRCFGVTHEYGRRVAPAPKPGGDGPAD
jgi:hypothetical protein